MNINLVEIDANKTVGKNPVLVMLHRHMSMRTAREQVRSADLNTPLLCLIRLLKS